jgi:hypothetical protein
VEDVELYLDGFAAVVQDLNNNGMSIMLEEMDICAPQFLSAFIIAIDRFTENIISNSGGGSGGNNPNNRVPVDGAGNGDPGDPPPSSPPQNLRKLLSTLDNEVLLFR